MSLSRIELLQDKIESRKRTFNQALNSVDPKFFETCKKFFEKYYLPIFAGGELEFKVIIDANIIISESLVYIKKKKSFLLQLLDSPFINVLAPSYVKDELARKTNELSKAKKIDSEIIRKAFNLFLSKIKLVKEIDDIAYKKAKELLGSKDEKDIPYLGVFFSIKAFAILTNDTHFNDLPDVQIWNRSGVAGRFVSVMQNGTISFYIASATTILLIEIIGEILLILLRALWRFTKFIARAIIWICNKGIEKFLELPSWLQLFLGIGLITLVLWEAENKVIRKSLMDITNRMVITLRNFLEKLSELVKSITPYLTEELIIWITLFTEHIKETIELYQKINPFQEKVLV